MLQSVLVFGVTERAILVMLNVLGPLVYVVTSINIFYSHPSYAVLRIAALITYSSHQERVQHWHFLPSISKLDPF